MVKIRVLLAACLLGVSIGALEVIAQTNVNDVKQTEWIFHVLTNIETIKVGMTRGQMLKVFEAEGGTSTLADRTYVFRGCPYIKVHFGFDPPHDRKAKYHSGRYRFWNKESDADVIISMSKPFLERTIID